MNVGLPGSGIGGLFYMLLAVLTLIHASWKRLRGRAGSAGWRMAARHSTMAALIASALGMESWAVGRVVAYTWAGRWLSRAGMLHDEFARVIAGQATVIAVASVSTLAAVLIVVHAAGSYLGFRESRRRAREGTSMEPFRSPPGTMQPLPHHSGVDS